MNDRSVLTDVYITVASGTIATFFTGGISIAWHWGDPVRDALVIGLGTMALVWTAQLWPRLRFPYVQLQEALWRIEQATNLDLDQNGIVGEPERERPIVISGAREPTSFERDLAYFLDEFFTNDRRSWREWNGRKRGWKRAVFPSGREVEQTYWEKLNGVLLNAGIATRNGTGTLMPINKITIGQAHHRAFQALPHPGAQ